MIWKRLFFLNLNRKNMWIIVLVTIRASLYIQLLSAFADSTVEETRNQINGYAWIGNFSFHNTPGYAYITTDHTVRYSHTRDHKVNFSWKFTLEVDQHVAQYRSQHGGSDTLAANELGDENGFSVIDVTGLIVLPEGESYTATGYTLLEASPPPTNPWKAEDTWPFVR